jgi:hypothetical protein
VRGLVVAAAGLNKVYDATTAATVTLSDNRVGGDVFSDNYGGASFNNKSVGGAKLVAVTGISISGADAANYSFNSTASTTADITQRALTVSAIGVNRIYDGTTIAPVALTDSRVVGDVLTETFSSASFADKNVGAAKPITVTGISIAGVDASNYSSNTTAATTANITARPIAIAAESKTKVLGSLDPAFTYHITSGSLISADSFTGNLTRTAGEAVGAYPILLGTVSLGGNYALAYTGASLNIVFAAATSSCLGSPGHTILQPVNVDGTSVFKQGSTVPAKFRVCDVNGNSISSNVVSNFVIEAINNGTVVATVNETVDSTTPDTTFRWSSSDQLWIFNINTKSYGKNNTYGFRIDLTDGSSMHFQFGLK